MHPFRVWVPAPEPLSIKMTTINYILLFFPHDIWSIIIGVGIFAIIISIIIIFNDKLLEPG